MVGDQAVYSGRRYFLGSSSRHIGGLKRLFPAARAALGISKPSSGRWRQTLRPQIFGIAPALIPMSARGTAASTIQPPSNLPTLAVTDPFHSPPRPRSWYTVPVAETMTW